MQRMSTRKISDQYRGTRVDETMAQQIEDALRETERRYRVLAENAADAIWTVDMDMCPTYISPSIARLLGYSIEEACCQSAKWDTF